MIHRKNTTGKDAGRFISYLEGKELQTQGCGCPDGNQKEHDTNLTDSKRAYACSRNKWLQLQAITHFPEPLCFSEN